MDAYFYSILILEDKTLYIIGYLNLKFCFSYLCNHSFSKHTQVNKQNLFTIKYLLICN